MTYDVSGRAAISGRCGAKEREWDAMLKRESGGGCKDVGIAGGLDVM